jgi:hypothetical protein
MVSDKELFIYLDKTKKGLINTSCGSNTLNIEGKGLIFSLLEELACHLSQHSLCT